MWKLDSGPASVVVERDWLDSVSPVSIDNRLFSGRVAPRFCRAGNNNLLTSGSGAGTLSPYKAFSSPGHTASFKKEVVSFPCGPGKRQETS